MQLIDETDAIPCAWQRFRMNDDRHLIKTLKQNLKQQFYDKSFVVMVIHVFFLKTIVITGA